MPTETPTWTLKGTGQTSGLGWALKGLLRGYDKIIDEPIRMAVSQILQGRSPYSIVYDPKTPTWEEIAQELGITGKSLEEISPRFSGSASKIPLSSLAGAAMGMIADPLPGGELKAAKKAVRMGEKVEDVASLGKKVFHGSPHKFEKFDYSKIGTGEGAQAFGSGLYFSERPEIAKTYAMAGGLPKLKIDKKEIPLWNSGYKKNEEEVLIKLRQAYNKQEIKSKEKAFKQVESQLTNKNDKTILNNFKRMNIELESSKHLYTARIPEGDYLKWDKRVSLEQMEKLGVPKKASVKYEGMRKKLNQMDFYKQLDTPEWNALQSEMRKIRNKHPFINETGENVYRILREQHGAESASKLLHKAGIKGIDYPAGSLSGVKGSKARNYVVFSDEGISIEDIKKLMLLGAGAGVGATAINQ